MSKFKELFNSKKFIVSIITFVVMILNFSLDLGLSVEEAIVSVSPFISYIVGQGLADIKKG